MIKSETEPLYVTDIKRDSADCVRDRAALQGYLLCPGFFEPAMIKPLRERVLAACADLGLIAGDCDWSRPVAAPGRTGLAYDDPVYIELQRQVLASAECHELREKKEISGLLETISGYSLHSGYGDVLRITFPNSTHLTTEAHQERHYINNCKVLWIAWIPLLDCPLLLGPLALAAGSHRTGLQAHKPVTGAIEAYGRYALEDADSGRWLSSAMDCGDVIFFHGFTAHRACPNLSTDRIRLSFDFRYGI